jgi:hypothetical protein
MKTNPRERPYILPSASDLLRAQANLRPTPRIASGLGKINDILREVVVQFAGKKYCVTTYRANTDLPVAWADLTPPPKVAPSLG